MSGKGVNVEGKNDYVSEITSPAKQTLPPGTAYLASCSEGQISLEDEDFKHGVFMHFFLEGLTNRNKDGVVTIGWLSDFACYNTERHVAGKVKFEGRQQLPELVRGQNFKPNAIIVPKPTECRFIANNDQQQFYAC